MIHDQIKYYSDQVTYEHCFIYLHKQDLFVLSSCLKLKKISFQAFAYFWGRIYGIGMCVLVFRLKCLIRTTVFWHDLNMRERERETNLQDRKQFLLALCCCFGNVCVYVCVYTLLSVCVWVCVWEPCWEFHTWLSTRVEVHRTVMPFLKCHL